MEGTELLVKREGEIPPPIEQGTTDWVIEVLGRGLLRLFVDPGEERPVETPTTVGGA